MEILWNTSRPRERSKLVTASKTALYRLSAPTPSTGRSSPPRLYSNVPVNLALVTVGSAVSTGVDLSRSVAAVKRSPYATTRPEGSSTP